MTDPVLSVVFPYFRKRHVFGGSLPANLSLLDRVGVEVIVVADEPADAGRLEEALRGLRYADAQIIRNPFPHEWRSPSRALNVGIRHASAPRVMLGEVESYLLADPMEFLPSSEEFVIGRVAFGTFAQLSAADGDLSELFERSQAKSSVPLFYGCTIVPTAAVGSVRGFDESITGWGGDDDNLRLRLMMAGYRMRPEPRLRTVHVSDDDRPLGHAADHHPRNSPEERVRIFNPDGPLANSAGWGRDFDDVVRIHR